MFRRVILLGAALSAVAGLTVSAPSAAEPIELPDLLGEGDSLLGFEDELLSCTEFIPHTISVQEVPTTLDVLVLLDGVQQSIAEEAVADMRVAYQPLSISVVPSYQTVSFTTIDAVELNQAAKDLFGGVRPDGIDVVYTMTSKDVTSTGPTGGNVAGLADCIGGIRYDDHAFAVGEVIPDGPGSLLGIPLPIEGTDQTGKTMAHEIGHLLGGHHHYFSVEGLLAENPNVATLMGPALGIISLRFSTLNSLMVRGHMELYGDN